MKFTLNYLTSPEKRSNSEFGDYPKFYLTSELLPRDRWFNNMFIQIIFLNNLLIILGITQKQYNKVHPRK